MSERLGKLVTTARNAKGWSLYELSRQLEAGGFGRVNPGTLGHMAVGTRPGDPKLWSALWSVLRLDWTELYAEWGLPDPKEGEDREVREFSNVFVGLSAPARTLVASYARHADQYVESIGVLSKTPVVRRAPLQNRRNLRDDPATSGPGAEDESGPFSEGFKSKDE